MQFIDTRVMTACLHTFNENLPYDYQTAIRARVNSGKSSFSEELEKQEQMETYLFHAYGSG